MKNQLNASPLRANLGILAIYLLVFGFAFPSLAQTPPTVKIQTPFTMQYGHDPQESVDIYQAPGTGNPAVVVIHGGGFIGGDKGQEGIVWACSDFVAHGITCFSINYRLMNRYDNTTQGFAQFIEVQLAMRWVRAHAGLYGVNPDKVGAWGESAGAWHAAILGATWLTLAGGKASDPEDDPWNESSELTAYSSHADYVVGISVPVDAGALARTAAETAPPTLTLTPPAWNIYDLFNLMTEPFPWYQTASLTNPLLIADGLTTISPISLVNNTMAKTAPMYILQGNADPYLPAATQSDALAAALKIYGVPYQYVTYPGGHAFCADSTIPCDNPAWTTYTEYEDQAAAWVALTEGPGASSPPAPPTNFVATLGTNSTVNLSWTKPASSVAPSWYNIYRGSSTAAATLLATTNNGTTSTYSDNSVYQNASYTYYIAAYYGGPDTPSVSAPVSTSLKTPSSFNKAPADTTPPTAPIFLSAPKVDITTSSIHLYWLGSSTDTGGSGLAGYKAFCNTGASVKQAEQFEACSTSVGTTNCTVTGLTPGTEYACVVQAYDNANNMSVPSWRTTPTTLN